MKRYRLGTIALLLLTTLGSLPSHAVTAVAGNGAAVASADAPAPARPEWREELALLGCGVGNGFAISFPAFASIGVSFCGRVLDVMFW